jgi:hypothetical protein
MVLYCRKVCESIYHDCSLFARRHPYPLAFPNMDEHLTQTTHAKCPALTMLWHATAPRSPRHWMQCKAASSLRSGEVLDGREEMLIVEVLKDTKY